MGRGSHAGEPARGPQMVDLHCHILPGLDDGPSTLEAAVDLGRAAAAAGVDTVVATPHVREDYPFPIALIDERVDAVRSALGRAGIPLRILSGGELALSMIPELDDGHLARLCLGEGRYLLVESPYTQAPSLLETALFDLQLRGFRPLLAHPERSVNFLRDPDRLERLVEKGVLCSVTAMSVAGAFGDTIRDFTSRLFAAGAVHNVASDAHDAARRGPGFDAALEELEKRMEGGLEAARWFTEDAARAIAAGDELPGRPPAFRSGGFGWRRFKGRVGLGH